MLWGSFCCKNKCHIRLNLMDTVIAFLMGMGCLEKCHNIKLVDHRIHNACHYKGCQHIKQGMLFDKYSGEYDGNTQDKRTCYNAFAEFGNTSR